MAAEQPADRMTSGDSPAHLGDTETLAALTLAYPLLGRQGKYEKAEEMNRQALGLKRGGAR